MIFGVGNKAAVAIYIKHISFYITDTTLILYLR